MSVLKPTPRLSHYNPVNGAEGDTEVGSNRFQNLTRLASASDRLHIVSGELVPGAGPSKVTHVLAVVPEIEVSQVHTSDMPVVAGVQDVGFAGVTVMEHPHSPWCWFVATVDGNGPSLVPKRRLAFIGDRLRSLAENISETVTVERFGWTRVAESFHALVVHSAVTVLAMLAVASIDLTRFHNQNYNTTLGV